MAAEAAEWAAAVEGESITMRNRGAAVAVPTAEVLAELLLE